MHSYGHLHDIHDSRASKSPYIAGPCVTCANPSISWVMWGGVMEIRYHCALAPVGNGGKLSAYICHDYQYEPGTDDEELVPWADRFPKFPRP